MMLIEQESYERILQGVRYVIVKKVVQWTDPAYIAATTSNKRMAIYLYDYLRKENPSAKIKVLSLEEYIKEVMFS